MSSLNQAHIIGRLGKNPELRYTPDGLAITSVSIATSENYKDKSGEKVENTEWHRVIFYKNLAEIAGQYLTKGSLVYISGQIKTRKWADKDGIERYTTEIHAREMKMLGSKDDSAPRQQERKPEPRQAQPEQSYSGGGVASLKEDIPFNQLPSTYAI